MDPSGRKSRKPAAVIKGTDTEDGGACDAGAEADSWRITAVVSEDQSKIFVDFSPKVSRATPASLSLSSLPSHPPLFYVCYYALASMCVCGVRHPEKCAPKSDLNCDGDC